MPTHNKVNVPEKFYKLNHNHWQPIENITYEDTLKKWVPLYDFDVNGDEICIGIGMY